MFAFKESYHLFFLLLYSREKLYCSISVQLPPYCQWVVGHGMNVWLVLSLGGRGRVFIYSTHPVLIYLSAGCRERQASPFAAWLCAGSVIQYSTSAEGEAFLTL